MEEEVTEMVLSICRNDPEVRPLIERKLGQAYLFHIEPEPERWQNAKHERDMARSRAEIRYGKISLS